MATFNKLLTVTNASYPAANAPSVQIPFEPRKITLVYFSGGATGKRITVSMDGGTSDAVVLDQDRKLPLYESHVRVSNLHVKSDDATAVLQIIAES